MPQFSQESVTSKTINTQITYIYHHLIRLGYPKILQPSFVSIQQIQPYLISYFQPTASRMHLIEWLIATVLPQYRELACYLTEKRELQRLVRVLWKLGVMPFSKHTSNLDYEKFVQGTLGYENSVLLVYNLTELAYENVLSKKSKPDLSFGQFFHEAIQNFTQLVNQNYDLYGITFPAKFINPNPKKSEESRDSNTQLQSQFLKEYEKFYQEKMVPLLSREDEILEKIFQSQRKVNKSIDNVYDQSNKFENSFCSKEKQQSKNKISLQQFIANISTYSKQYSSSLNELTTRISSLLEEPQAKSRLISHFLQQSKLNKNLGSQEQSSKVNFQKSIQNRTIKISPEFCSKYQVYKKLLRQIKTAKEDIQFIEKRAQLILKLEKINENVKL